MSNQSFTIEDIHEIRRQMYEETKHMTNRELLEHTKKEAAESLAIIERIRAQKKAAAGE